MQLFSRLFVTKPALTAVLPDLIRHSFHDAVADPELFPSSIVPRLFHVPTMFEFFRTMAGGPALGAGDSKGPFYALPPAPIP